MTESAAVSVVIPAFRAERFIADAIRSVLCQTRPPAEIVVVDDGSPQPLERHLRSFLSDIFYVRHSNLGPAAARNTGVAMTTAPWIAFLDADDLWEPTKLEKQLQFLASHPECAVVASDAWVFGDGREIRRKHQRGEAGGVPDLSLEGLLRWNTINMLTTVVRRDVFAEAGGFDEDPELIAVEDYDLWLKIAERWKIGWIHEPLARYRLSSGSLSDPVRFVVGVDAVLGRAARRLRDRPELQGAIRDHRSEMRRDLAWQLLESDQAVASLEPILESLALTPGDPRSWKLVVRAVLQRVPLVRRLRSRLRAPSSALSSA